MDVVMHKRERTRNFTECEKKLLLDIVQQNLDIVEDKTSKCKFEIWQNISQEFNSTTIFGFRTWKQLRYLYKNMKKNRTAKSEDGSNPKQITTKRDRMTSLLRRQSEPVENCNDSSNLYYEDLPVIIQAVRSDCDREDLEVEIAISDSEPDQSYRSDPLLPDIELSSKPSTKSNKKPVNFTQNITSNYPSKHTSCAEDVLWKKLELRLKKDIYEHKLKALKDIHEQELKVKREMHEQELLIRKENHDLEKQMKMKLLELESENWDKRNKLLDLEIALKEKQLNK